MRLRLKARVRKASSDVKSFGGYLKKGVEPDNSTFGSAWGHYKETAEKHRTSAGRKSSVSRAKRANKESLQSFSQPRRRMARRNQNKVKNFVRNIFS